MTQNPGGLSHGVITVALLMSLCVCLAAKPFTQSRAVQYDKGFGPSFYEMSLSHGYPGSYKQIESIDFRNMTLDIIGKDRNVEASAKLEGGNYEHKISGGLQNFKLDSIHYLPSAHSDRQFALLLWTVFSATGSSNTDGFAQVYELKGTQLELVQQIGWDEHFDTNGPYVLFNQQKQALTVRSGHYLPGDAHCCVSAVDVVTLQWGNDRFTKKTVSVELSNYGLKSGKKL